MVWKSNFKKGKELILATSTKKGQPNANIVMSLGFIDKKSNSILIANCQMNKTFKNLLENNSLCVVSGYYRIKGNVKIYYSGKYFNKCLENNKDAKYLPKCAIIINVKEVFNLDKVKVVF
ncbi:MAG: pyridoxamine 5'-phosphate oxidase family protein [Candidatus Woesearchaeota archaeon]|jgi:predicted pyridoxine 5'-phosphate oxidase superfamily flavin-nucleotide-binding protein